MALARQALGDVDHVALVAHGDTPGWSGSDSVLLWVFWRRKVDKLGNRRREMAVAHLHGSQERGRQKTYSKGASGHPELQDGLAGMDHEAQVRWKILGWGKVGLAR